MQDPRVGQMPSSSEDEDEDDEEAPPKDKPLPVKAAEAAPVVYKRCPASSALHASPYISSRLFPLEGIKIVHTRTLARNLKFCWLATWKPVSVLGIVIITSLLTEPSCRGGAHLIVICLVGAMVCPFGCGFAYVTLFTFFSSPL